MTYKEFVKVKDGKHIVMFDKPMSARKQREGLAVHWAIVSGACTKCSFLKRCENDDRFKFPPNAPCMVHMNGDV